MDGFYHLQALAALYARRQMRMSSHSVTSLGAASRSVCKGTRERNVPLESSNTHQLLLVKAFLYSYSVFMHWAAKWQICCLWQKPKCSPAAFWDYIQSQHVTHVFFLSTYRHLLAVPAEMAAPLPAWSGGHVVSVLSCTLLPSPRSSSSSWVFLIPGRPPLAIEGAEPMMINGCWASPWPIALYCLIETVACFSVFSL